MTKKTALVVIDVQHGVVKEAYQRDEVLANIARLLEQARSTDTPVIYVQHHFTEGNEMLYGADDWQIHPAVAPREGELIVHKASPDAFHETTLQAELEKLGIERLVMTGAQSEVCVETSARRAPAQGFNVTLVSDAHTTDDRKALSAAQIIDVVNAALNGFWAGAYTATEKTIVVKPTSDIDFA
jgi:nicotinamidase-related amidase